MTWAEFQIRLFSFNRMQKNEWEKVNFLSNTLIEVAPYMKSSDKNKIMKSNYIKLFGKPKINISDSGRALLIQKQKEYQNRNKK